MTDRTTDAGKMKEALLAEADKNKIDVLSRFFKTGTGSYGQGDTFAGIPVPVIRKMVKKFPEARLSALEELLHDSVHECRMFALLAFVEQFKRADENRRKEIVDLYLRNTSWINNWDLVDLSAYQIIGNYLKNRDRSLLCRLASGGMLWEQRIAIVSTWIYIRAGEFDDTLKIAELLLDHPHDLIRKAVGWMLREVGKRDKAVLTAFLHAHYRQMPRTMLRYAIEKFTPEERIYFLKKECFLYPGNLYSLYYYISLREIFMNECAKYSYRHP